MDDTALQAPRASRPVELANSGRLHSATAGSPIRGGSTPALGETGTDRRTDALQGIAGVFVSSGSVRNPGESAETLRTLSGQTKRQPLGTGEALPGDQEGCMSPPTRLPGGFVMDFNTIAKVSVVKRQAEVEAFKGRRQGPRKDRRWAASWSPGQISGRLRFSR